jgi:site-specific DNA-methyltransferase (adenine-specific)
LDRSSPGEVRDAIVSALEGCSGDASVKEIHDIVALQLGHDVPASSVRSYLQLNTPELFARTSRGRYQLVREINQLEFIEASPLEEVAIGGARLIQGDCFSWLSAAPRTSVHAIVTDPPYGLVEYSRTEQRKLRDGRGGVWRIPPSFDGHQRSPLPRFTILKPDQVHELHTFFLRWTRTILRVLVPGAHVVVASNPLVSYVVSDALARGGLERRGEIIRLVMTMRGGDRPKNAHQEFPGVSVMPRSMWEPWLLFRKPLEGRVQDNLRKWKTGGLRRISETQPFGDVIQSHPTRKEERSIAPHPSLKPQAFLREVVRAVLPLGEGVILDPFAGSGSTLAAAESVGYESIGIENDLDYFRIAEQAIPRLAALQAKAPHRSSR